MKAYHTTSCFGLEQLEQRRMLSADLSSALVQPLDVSSGQDSVNNQVPLANAAARTQVPFKGTLEGTYTRTGTFPFFHIDPTGAGQATHLGQFSFHIPHDVNLSLTPPGGTGTFEFTAANGDTVYGTFLTSATPVPGMPGVLHGVEPMTILGGTGRFANASGSFLCERLVDTVNFTTTGSFEGTISSPGAAGTIVSPASAAPIGLATEQVSGQQPFSSASIGSDHAQDDQAVVTQVLE